METRIDKDLQFLSGCPNDELKKLCDIITFDQWGNYRLTEQLSNTDSYLSCYPDQMARMVGPLSNELLRYGSNSIICYFRGETDSYADILWRVCKSMKADTTKNADVNSQEYALLFKLCHDAISRMSVEELHELAEIAGIAEKSVNKQLTTAAILLIIRRNPRIFARVITFIARRIITFLAGRTALKLGTGTLERVLGVVTGPVGWVALTAWTLWDLSTPALRVCIPAVFQIAIMRMENTPKLAYRRAS